MNTYNDIPPSPTTNAPRISYTDNEIQPHTQLTPQAHSEALPRIRTYTIGTAHSIGLVGLQAWLLTIQSSISPGLPQFSIIGLPDAVLQESRERVRATFSACMLPWPQSRLTVNLSPASVPKTGSNHDIALALSICIAQGIIDKQALIGVLALGELSLDGHVMPINGVLPMALHAANQGIHTLIVAHENVQEAQLVDGITVIGINHFAQIIKQFGKPQYRQRSETVQSTVDTTLSNQQYPPTVATSLSIQPTQTPGDMCQVIGQYQAKHALIVAAAGGHHIMMIGPPGTGKTMLASRFVSILPPLTTDEQLEVASIRSLVGTIHQYGITDIPPFEAPHHSATAAAIVGGGHTRIAPGAITKAHRGVLFLDEAPEFQPRVLQTIREPLETGSVTIVRAKEQATYPARVQLILAANPCPCGYGWGSGKHCTCSSKEKRRYFHRLSGPILDRIDIQIEVPLETQWQTSPFTESSIPRTSAAMRDIVIEARARAAHRFQAYGWSCNAMATGQWLREHTPSAALKPIQSALEQEQLSLRGADRAIRLAWTLADLEAKRVPTLEHIAAGLAMRTREHA